MIGKIKHYIEKEFRLYRLKKKVGQLGDKCDIGKYYCIEGDKLFIGDNVGIAEGAWIKASPVLNNSELELKIGNGCRIGRFNEIYATKSIILEEKVLTAERVYISDNLHGYNNPEIPIIDQSLIQNNTVRIGEGSWIGVGAVILGANIGKHCVIGSNAVVTHDVPDYSIAVGIPARIIKKYDFNQKKWIKV